MKNVVYICLILFLLLSSSFSLSPSQIGIILMHGKTGNPELMMTLAGKGYSNNGFIVVTPEMPWSKSRFIDKSVEQSFDEIEAIITSLKQQGVKVIILAGHSMGADLALAYAANRGDIDGVVLLAPGHIPDLPKIKNEFSLDVARAKSMINAGQGNIYANFNDTNNQIKYIRHLKASIYYSYFNPDGLAAAQKSAKTINPRIPVLYVAGADDPLTEKIGESYIYGQLPLNVHSTYNIVATDHMGTPRASVPIVVNWINSNFE